MLTMVLMMKCFVFSVDNGMDDEMDIDFEEFLRQQQHPQ